MKKILFLFLLIGINCFSQEEEFTKSSENESKKEEKSKEEIFTYVEESASFPGGMKKMQKFIAKKIIIPQKALKYGISGKCYLKFVIDKKGYITNVSVMKGVPNCPECDLAAIEVIKKMPRWKPATADGKKVYSYFTIPINFDIK